MTWRTTASIRLLVIISLIAMILLLLASSVGAGQTTGTAEHRVISGETLWEIAGDYTPDGESVQRTVAEIQRLSDVSGSMIQPGQVLVVPIIEG